MRDAALGYSPAVIHNMTQLRFRRALPGLYPLSFLRVARNNEETPRVRVDVSRSGDYSREKQTDVSSASFPPRV